MRPLRPVHVADLFDPLHAELLTLLRGLSRSDWLKPTVARGWAVRDVAAHVLDGDIRKLSFHRDGLTVPRPDLPPGAAFDLVAFLNGRNADWIRVAQRISPTMIVELLALTGPQIARFVSSLDPDGAALFAVAWAGESVSPNWFDTGREYTERWHHQQQIRDAVGAPALTAPQWLHPVLDVSVRALPFGYRETPASPGSAVAFDVTGPAGGTWTVVRESERWELYEGAPDRVDCRLVLDQDTAWRLFFKALSADAAHDRVAIHGSAALAEPALRTLAIMA